MYVPPLFVLKFWSKFVSTILFHLNFTPQTFYAIVHNHSLKINLTWIVDNKNKILVIIGSFKEPIPELPFICFTFCFNWMSSRCRLFPIANKICLVCVFSYLLIHALAFVILVIHALLLPIQAWVWVCGQRERKPAFDRGHTGNDVAQELLHHSALVSPNPCSMKQRRVLVVVVVFVAFCLVCRRVIEST